MGAVDSRESFFDIGLDVLSDLGYGGLKLAEVCQRLGVTTGSFYHYFPNWSAYTRELIAHWHEGMTVEVIDAVRSEPDPRLRIDKLADAALTLPHGAEAAIRVWSAIDPEVRSVQAAVDHQRYQAMYECALQILESPHQAELFAAWSVYLLVGYEQAILPRDVDNLKWLIKQLLDAADSGRFSTVPPRD
ncbi:transcriptional regulator [Mycolicibacterium chubuense NBB4]|uniref:Transcriptional regulator n=1 Tax=Mycolicibacterium chubuense (strain NBB4) TaxID=710421 RepID=I4BCB1_MYCCN|nr:TetR/AcrR family transcriptional regulator [Mycolicibacterium chubuense]AFM14918.1 transcriptional regulator [Mycolicibacterium chubuense NBB4]